MEKKKICLASDNWTSAHPLILKAIGEANEGYAPAYGTDAWTEEVQNLMHQVFQSTFKVLILPTGTGSNVLSLRICSRPHESVLCSDVAHIEQQESGAAQAVVGCKLITVPSHNGKITPDAIRKKLHREKAFGKHSTFPRTLSITQSTETGTVYTLDELRAIAKLCKEENLFLHVDGSRLYNAAVHLQTSLAEIINAANPDILSLGGTKNGLMGAEALLIFNPQLQEGSEYLQKQTLQLMSKMRYLSVQYLPFLKTDLWRTLALHANQKAAEIAAIVAGAPGFAISYPVETNQIFFTMPPDKIAPLQEQIFCYPWNVEKHEFRFVTSWNTSDEDVAMVRQIFKEI